MLRHAGVSMNRIVLATGVAIAAFTGSAFAADLPSRHSTQVFAPPPPIPLFTWTGFYVGVQAGYEFGRDNAALAVPALGSAPYGYSPNGVVGGGHAGYNYQFSSIFGGNGAVVGIEGDVEGADYRRGATTAGLGSTTTRSDVKGSIRGRFGVAVDRVLFYATGGAAFADFQTRYDATPLFGAGAVDSFDHSRVGYTVGGGVEYAFMNTFSVRAEYRYSDYGTFTDQLVNAAPGLGASARHRETDNRVEAGVSYKFDTVVPAPVVAKY